jgi:hypothetical protein
MEALELLRKQVKETYAWLEMTVEDVSAEQANWRPPGTANSIGAVYAHALIAADSGLSTQMRGIIPIMASEYRGHVGISEMPPFGRDWGEWARRVHVDWPNLRRYGSDVRQRVEEYVDSATDAELTKRIDMTFAELGIWAGLDLFNLHGINHIRIHGGEIACLKGLQGGRGWSQGPVYRG